MKLVLYTHACASIHRVACAIAAANRAFIFIVWENDTRDVCASADDCGGKQQRLTCTDHWSGGNKLFVRTGKKPNVKGVQKKFSMCSVTVFELTSNTSTADTVSNKKLS
jgi:hypothetical protein